MGEREAVQIGNHPSFRVSESNGEGKDGFALDVVVDPPEWWDKHNIMHEL